MSSPRFSSRYDDESGEIGFANLPEQIHRKTLKRGFDFTLMVVGESGLGKSTLINSLFLTDLYKNRAVPSVEDRISKTTQIEKKHMDIEEKGVRLRLTVVDTPGYGDQVNLSDCWQPIHNYIEESFEQYFKDESGLNRKNIVDNRVHCCLYFISPYGHGLRQVDVEFMKHLHDKVNLVPIIAKADVLTPAELKKLKERVVQEISKHKIQIYTFPECDSDEDDEFIQQDRSMKSSIPFAVIASNTVIEVNGKRVRGRQYPWGIIEVENSKHSDFTKLRTFLIGTHMQDLKEITRDVHYENYRLRCISKITQQQATRERMKLKRDSCQNFDGVAEQDKRLQEKDAEIARMQQMLSQMQAQLRNQSQ